MKKICLSLLGITVFTSCTLKPIAKISVNLKMALGNLNSVDQIQNRNVETGPSDVSKMDCFVVSVSGSGITPTPFPANSNLSNALGDCPGFGTLSNLMSASDLATHGTTLQIIPGSQRTIQVFGILSNSATGCTGKSTLFDFVGLSERPALFEVGKTTTDIFLGTSITVRNNYSQATSTDLISQCSGVPNPPKNLGYTTNAAVYTQGTIISNNTPTVSGGTVAGYSIKPDLPAGLSLHATSGVISGTPNALQSATTHTITASNTGGSTRTTVSITVIDIAPAGLTYTTSSPMYTKGTPIGNNSPTSSGGAVVSYSVSPVLPTGLSFNASTGVISGTPTALQPTTTYTVTATNTGGSTTKNLSLTIISWTWISGSNFKDQPGVYSREDTRATSPGARAGGCSWIDSSGYKWLFGGYGYGNTAGTLGYLNDLWKFDGSSWTFVSGGQNTDGTAYYGTQGSASSNNHPGSRWVGGSWSDSSGKFWLFGGTGFAAPSEGILNDLWKYDGTNWAWMKGSSSTNGSPTYGTQGTAATDNTPGARYDVVSVQKNSSGDFWLFGGYGNDSSNNYGNLNDLWKFNGTNWTWVSGSKFQNTAGVYGTLGQAASANAPGGRQQALGWADSAGKVWIFGGNGRDYSTNIGILNDLWKFDGTSWTWVSGSNLVGASAVYGTLGVPSSSNVPGPRGRGVTWVDSADRLWLFGGEGKDYQGTTGYINDVWRFDGTNWTWMGGSNTVNASGNYGIQGNVGASYYAGGRSQAVSWFDSSGFVWLFGGMGRDSAGNTGKLNDLWKF